MGGQGFRRRSNVQVGGARVGPMGPGKPFPLYLFKYVRKSLSGMPFSHSMT